MADASPTPRFRPLAVGLAAAAAPAAVLVPLVPESLRPLNFALFGAVGVFAAARGGRLGWVAGLGLMTLAKLAFDLINYADHRYDADYLPMPTVYLAMTGYILAGWVGRSFGAAGAIGAAVGGSSLFFLLSNFASWVGQAMPYPMTPAGLLTAYEAGLPFHRATFVSDIGFTAVLVGLHAALELVARPAAVRVDDTPRG